MFKKSKYSLVPTLGLTPWIISVHGRHKQIQTFFNPLDDKLYHRSIPEMRQKLCFGCSNSHLMLVDEDSSKCCLLNLITAKLSNLPSLLPNFSEYTSFFLLSSSSDHVIPMVFVVKHRSYEHGQEIMTCRAGDIEWRTFHKLDSTDIGGIVSGIVSPSNGNIYLVSAYDKLIIIDISSLVVRLINAKTIRKRSDHFSDMYILVEYHGELFQVIAYLHFPFKFYCAEVYKLNESDLKWKRVERLGKNRAIFLPNFNIGHLLGYMVDDPRVKGDSIYFVESRYDGMKLYRFSLEEREIILHKLFCPNVADFWFHKSCYLAMATS